MAGREGERVRERVSETRREREREREGTRPFQMPKQLLSKVPPVTSPSGSYIAATDALLVGLDIVQATLC